MFIKSRQENDLLQMFLENNMNKKRITRKFVCLFEALYPRQELFSHFGRASWVKPVLSNGDEVSSTRTLQSRVQHSPN